MPMSRFILLGLLSMACAGRQPGPSGEPTRRIASAFLQDDAGTRVGLATFSTGDTSASLAISTGGLTPGPHGIHIHEHGDCTPPDFMTAGAHFNPSGRKHGLENPEGPHAGDLPNLVVNANGSADTTFHLRAEALRPDSQALVIHAKADDQRSDPAGNSGGRIYCGVIQRD
jgi:superoxide dismutase, Cu-Zn family